MNYGECLKLMLNTLNISMSRLSKQINVDSSLVCRWVNGNRIPQYGTSYINSIAEYLSKNINNSYQEEGIKKLYESFYGNQDNTILNMILRLLNETQGYSLEKQKQKNKGQSVVNNVPASSMPNNVEEVTSPYGDFLMNSISLSSQDSIIVGFETILDCIQKLVYSATRYKKLEAEDRIIYITYNSLKFSYCSKEWLETLSNRLLLAIEQNWTVVFLLKIGIDMEKIVSFLHFITPFLKTGKIKAYYFRNYDPAPFERELYVIPNIGVLSTLSTEPKSMNNYGFYLRSKKAIQIFVDYLKNVVNNQTVELFQYYPNGIYDDFLKRYHLYLKQVGNIYNYNCHYNLLLISENLYQMFIKRTSLNNHEQEQCMLYHKAHHNMHHELLQLYNVYEIYYTDSIDLLIRNCNFKLYTPYGVKIVDIDYTDIIDYIKNVIKHIQSMEHYHVAVIYNNMSSVNNISFSIKEKQSLFVHKIDNDFIRYICDEPMTVKGMEDFYMTLWKQIAPVNKDKKEIVQWLSRYIERLQKKLV